VIGAVGLIFPGTRRRIPLFHGSFEARRVARPEALDLWTTETGFQARFQQKLTGPPNMNLEKVRYSIAAESALGDMPI
jgi:hypothetical protein